MHVALTKRTKDRRALLALAALALGACSTPPSTEPPPADPAPPAAPPAAAAPEPESAAPATPVSFALAFEHEDSELAAELEPVLRSGARDVERWFGQPFREPFEVLILPDRAAFTASFPPEWEMGETACWMVAAGVAERLHVLSPRVWKSEACEHDPEDERHLRELLTHELVHVFHGQHNPTKDFTGVEGLDWFVEGLATLASGQLDDPGRASAREALEKGAGPARLADAWKGKYRYGVSGSLVEFLEREVGRETLVRMLAATTLEEAFALAGTSEAELLEGWRASVLAGAGG